MPAANFQVKRIYTPPSATDGARILVDRLWPRGVSKQKASLTLWMKDIAPSPALREWFGHQPERFYAFSEKYRQELDTDPAKQAAARELFARAEKVPVTLLYAAKDPAVNHAVVLLAWLQRHAPG